MEHNFENRIITGEYDQASGRKGYFRLEYDQVMFYQTWHAPINWTGTINGTEVSFVQTSSDSYDEGDFDFSDLDDQFRDAIPHIIEAIDDAMRIMD